MRIASFAFLWEAILSDSVYGGRGMGTGWGNGGRPSFPALERKGVWPVMKEECLLLPSQDLFQLHRLAVGCLLSAAASLLPSAQHGSSSLFPGSRPEFGAQGRHPWGRNGTVSMLKRKDLTALETIASPWALLFSWLIRPMRTFWEMLAGQKEAFKY